VEVEGGSDSEISSVVQKLGLDGLIPIRESYAALIRSSPGAAQTRPLVVRF
jgi:hypothetical protein